MVRMICISLRAALILVLAHTTLFMGWECAPVNYKPNLWYQSPTFSTESLVLAVLHVAAAIFVIISLLGDIELQILMMMMNAEHATTNSDTAANVGWSKQTVLFIRKQYWRELSWHQNIPLLVFLFFECYSILYFFPKLEKACNTQGYWPSLCWYNLKTSTCWYIIMCRENWTAWFNSLMVLKGADFHSCQVWVLGC